MNFFSGLLVCIKEKVMLLSVQRNKISGSDNEGDGESY